MWEVAGSRKLHKAKNLSTNVETPDPLPLGEGKDAVPSPSPRERARRQRWDRCVQREMWDTLKNGIG
jgi:hypothetical protein